MAFDANLVRFFRQHIAVDRRRCCCRLPSSLMSLAVTISTVSAAQPDTSQPAQPDQPAHPTNQHRVIEPSSHGVLRIWRQRRQARSHDELSQVLKATRDPSTAFANICFAQLLIPTKSSVPRKPKASNRFSCSHKTERTQPTTTSISPAKRSRPDSERLERPSRAAKRSRTGTRGNFERHSGSNEREST